MPVTAVASHTRKYDDEFHHNHPRGALPSLRRRRARAMRPASMATPALAKGQQGDDAALIEGAKLIAELARKLEAANDHYSECYDRYEEIRPRKPETLLWGLGSPVTYCKGPRHHKDGKIYLWCDVDEIEEFCHKTFFQYSFIGTEPVLEEHDTELLDANWPVEGWERWVDKRRQKRVAKLLADYDEWKAADNAAYVMCGVTAACTAASDCEDAVWQVYDQMHESRPRRSMAIARWRWRAPLLIGTARSSRRTVPVRRWWRR